MDKVEPRAAAADVSGQAEDRQAPSSAFLSMLALAARRLPPLPAPLKGLRLEFRPDALLKVTTDDGCRVMMARYFPRGRRRFAEPVVLCHGLGANRFTFDFQGRHSLARRLAERGFEAWILELRGRGLAGPSPTTSFDRQVTYDVGAALRTIRESGAKEALWVGHSKGGMLALAHLSKDPRAPIRAVAALGSPTTFSVQKGLRPFARLIRPLLTAPRMPIEQLGKLALFIPPPDWFMRYLVCPENLDPQVRRFALANVGSDVSSGVGRQFLRWIAQGRWTSSDGSFDYERGLRQVRIPALLIGGTKDLLAPPAAAHHAASFLCGKVETVTAGLEGGFAQDYGHGDLVLGRNAPEELYPLVIDFLERHASEV